MPFPLRDYQHAAIAAIERRVDDGLIRPAVVLPTGGGKTTVFSRYLDRPSARRRGRGLVVAHRDELIDQAIADLRDNVPHLRIGKVQGAVDQVGADIVVASVQTLRQPRRLARLRDVGTVVVDECHHAPAESYLAILRHYGAIGPAGDTSWTPPPGSAVALGVTATLSRSDNKSLGDIWQDVVYQRSIQDLIDSGHLVRPRAVRVDIPELHLERVRKTAGDFANGALGEALEGSLAPEKVAEAYVEHAAGKQGVLFSPTVSSAYAFSQALQERGMSTAVIHGAMKAEDRRARLEEFRKGKVQVLCNCMVLTEGTNLPMIEVVVIARPTKSRGLFIQMAGRGLRLDPANPGKTEALILIVTDASEAHQLIAPIELFGAPPKPKRELPDAWDDEGDEEPGEVPEVDEIVIETPHYRGPVIFTEVDLFASGSSAWAQTHAGVWFTRTGDQLVCILPGRVPSTFDVLYMHHATPGRSAWIQRDLPDLRYAMSAADEYVALRRGAGPSPVAAMSRYTLIRAAERLGLHGAAGISTGELRSRVSVGYASVRIDPGIPSYVPKG